MSVLIRACGKTSPLCNSARRLSGVTDNSLYPVMFMSYLDVLVPGIKDSWYRTCVPQALIWQLPSSCQPQSQLL